MRPNADGSQLITPDAAIIPIKTVFVLHPDGARDKPAHRPGDQIAARNPQPSIDDCQGLRIRSGFDPERRDPALKIIVKDKNLIGICRSSGGSAVAKVQEITVITPPGWDAGLRLEPDLRIRLIPAGGTGSIHIKSVELLPG